MGATLTTGKTKGAAPEINITPLVDVVLVLLIIFMVVAPALNEGAAIELPKVLSPDAKSRDLNPIELTVLPDGTTIVDKKSVAFDHLRGTIAALHEQDRERYLMLKSDQGMKWGRMRRVFFDVQSVGFKGVLLKVVEQKKKGAAGGGA